MIVEFLEGGEFVLGLVTNPQAARGRLEVALASGRGLAVSPARILVSSDSEETGDKARRQAILQEVDRRRRELAALVEVEVLWGVLEGEGPEFAYAELAHLSFGRPPGPDELSAARRAVLDEGLHFAFAPQTARRRESAEIERLKAEREREAGRREYLGLGASWIAGALRNAPGEEPPRAGEATDELLNFVLDGPNSRPPRETRDVRDILALAGLPADSAGAFRALEALGVFHRHENLSLRRLGLPLRFDQAVLDEAAETARAFDLRRDERLDLTALPTATVDSPGAREFDDALSLEDLGGGLVRLCLHIADVAAMVRPGSLMEKWASGQASTIYLPEARYPMLPEELTESLCSLRQGLVRPAFSLLATLDAQGRVLDFGFKPTLIKVDLQVSFAAADEMLAGGRTEILGPLEEIARKLLASRLRDGGRHISLPQLAVSLDRDGRVELSMTDAGSRSNLMVEELMVLANHLAAKALMAAGVPCPYRGQEAPKTLNWYPPENPDERLLFAHHLACRRSMARAELSLEPSFHNGLGLIPYTSFTSPMRRYIDLLVARQLRALSLGRPPVYGHQEMLALSMPAEDTMRAIRRMQRTRQTYWLASCLKNQAGQKYQALIYDRKGRRGRVCVTELMLETEFGNLPPEAKPGRECVVQLVRATPRPDFIEDERHDSFQFEFVSLA
ncbi:MAG: RNB domain-containing ribonuclease [Deltaproteobacteria bacterium]|nr:RNB domain-containing ribonuclease [Deltaproteobacteria bacterium]